MYVRLVLYKRLIFKGSVRTDSQLVRLEASNSIIRYHHFFSSSFFNWLLDLSTVIRLSCCVIGVCGPTLRVCKSTIVFVGDF
jgi:hypothetical protein